MALDQSTSATLILTRITGLRIPNSRDLLPRCRGGAPPGCADALGAPVIPSLSGPRRDGRRAAHGCILLAPMGAASKKGSANGLPSRRRSLLLVAQIAPPSTHSGARRVAGLTKYLSRLGYRVTVLTSQAWGGGDIPGATRVIATPDLVGTRLNWRRDDFLALEGRHSSPSRADFDLARSLVVPDIATVSWLPFALPRAVVLARRNAFDCVITTSPPQSAHFIGLAVKPFVGAWIADFRDGWTFDRFAASVAAAAPTNP